MHSMPIEKSVKFPLGAEFVLKLMKRNDLKGSCYSGG